MGLRIPSDWTNEQIAQYTASLSVQEGGGIFVPELEDLTPEESESLAKGLNGEPAESAPKDEFRSKGNSTPLTQEPTPISEAATNPATEASVAETEQAVARNDYNKALANKENAEKAVKEAKLKMQEQARKTSNARSEFKKIKSELKNFKNVSVSDYAKKLNQLRKTGFSLIKELRTYKSLVKNYNQLALAFDKAVGAFKTAEQGVAQAAKITENGVSKAAGESVTQAEKGAAEAAGKGVQAEKGATQAAKKGFGKGAKMTQVKNFASKVLKSPKSLIALAAIAVGTIVFLAINKDSDDSSTTNVITPEEKQPKVNPQSVNTNNPVTEENSTTNIVTDPVTAGVDDNTAPVNVTVEEPTQDTDTIHATIPAENEAEDNVDVAATANSETENVDEANIDQDIADIEAEINTYTVKRGDCVWNIAKEELKNQNGKEPTNAEIQEYTLKIMEANGLHFEPGKDGLVLIYEGQELEL